jgi:hexokinase
MLTGIPEERIQSLKQNEEWFTIDTPALKRITEHCGNELDKGLSKDGGSIVSSGAWFLMLTLPGRRLMLNYVLHSA